MAKVGIFVEGESKEINGSFRVGFGKLFSKICPGKCPQVVLSDSINEAVKKFRAEVEGRTKRFETVYLLIDLDGPENEKDQVLQCRSLAGYTDQVFFMVQKMEAWFISQPAVLDQFYGENLSGASSYPVRPAGEVPNPDRVLEQLTKNTRKGRYHKVTHGAALLPLLNINNLCTTFTDVKNLKEILLVQSNQSNQS